MNAAIRIIFISIMSCLLLTAVNLDTVFSEQDTEPVKQLRRLYEADKAFRKTIQLAFENLHTQPDKSPNPWEGKDINDLCTFFNEWYYFLPNTGNGLEYIKKFTWFYYQNKYGLKFVKEEPGLSWTKEFVVARGKYMDSKASTSIISEWEKTPGTHMDEFIIPPGGFKSFNEFFTRNIKPGARPISAVTDNSVVVAPADCLINVIDPQLTADTKIPVKGRMKLNVQQLLNNSEYANLFVGGTAVSCILLPSTYHHYHAPVSGMVIQSEENVHDLYYGIEDFPEFYHDGNIGHNADFSIFEQFHHGYYVIETEKYGHVAMIPVGLNTISSVVFPEKYKEVTPQEPVPVHKGDDLGFFAYGGSLVILLFEKDRFPALKIPQGQRIGILNEKPLDE